jgi:hypothetical protein
MTTTEIKKYDEVTVNNTWYVVDEVFDNGRSFFGIDQDGGEKEFSVELVQAVTKSK